MPIFCADQSPAVAESGTAYRSTATGWADVLVDCPGTQDLFTYRLPEGLRVQAGDIVSVPFGSQQVGAIVIRCRPDVPAGLDAAQMREIDSRISSGFFPPRYWDLLQRVADYYYTPLIQVVRVALPPGLLARSQRRVRLLGSNPLAELPPELPAELPAELPMDTAAQDLLTVLRTSKTGDYSWQYLQRQVNHATRGLQRLLALGWVEQYLQPPTPVRPKQKQAVTLVSDLELAKLSPKQQTILGVLKRQGGEMWLADLLQQCQTSSSTLKTLAEKGCVVLHPREVLRSESTPAPTADMPKSLTAAQATAVQTLQGLSGFAQVLLHGVTGSGKTEVYLQAIAPVLHRGQSALVLVPEIGLTPQLTDRFRARFGRQVCVYHSALSDGERYDTWRQMLTGTAQVVIGTRSAVFAPLPNLGLIVLDEEHDPSFKQDQPAPCYHARQVASWRAEFAACPIVLGSATPALETWNSLGPGPTPTPGRHYLALPERVQARPLPPIRVVDMRQELEQGNRSILSRSLQAALQTLQERRQQGILFIHRRGHSTFVSCRSCGYVMTCRNCDVSLAYHQVQADATPILRCHYCNDAQPTPKTCPTCDSTYFKHFGSGTQRVTQELARLFPTLRVLRFDSDTTRTKGAHRALLTQFAQGEADVLVGTQMLTKGIDLPQVTLVGILAADGLLHFADFRASERTFQTLTQVAGRCGRGAEPGQVILQTYSPDHAVIQAVRHHAYESFVAAEMQSRSSLNYPPFGRLVVFRFSGANPVAVQTAAERVAQAIAPLQAQGVERLGPAPATILRVARRYRWQLLLKIPADSPARLPDLTALRSLCASSVSLTVDVDPLSLL